MFRHGRGHAQSILKFSLVHRIECDHGWTISRWYQIKDNRVPPFFFSFI